MSHCREQFADAKPYLQPGTNHIAIVIQPAAEAAQQQYAAYPYEVPTMSVRCPHPMPDLAVLVHCIVLQCTVSQDFEAMPQATAAAWLLT